MSRGQIGKPPIVKGYLVRLPILNNWHWANISEDLAIETTQIKKENDFFHLQRWPICGDALNETFGGKQLNLLNPYYINIETVQALNSIRGFHLDLALSHTFYKLLLRTSCRNLESVSKKKISQ